jgi:hypothetical protein
MRTILLLLALAQSSDGGLQDVCSVLNKGMALDHAPVVISGLIGGSPFHGYYLKMNTGHEPCPGWRKTVLTAPAMISIVWSDDYGVTLSRDERAANQSVLMSLQRRYSEGRLAPLPAVVSGVLIPKRFAMIFRHENGSYRGNGFGEEGACAAAIVVKSVRMPPESSQ